MTQAMLTPHEALELLAEVFVEPVANLKPGTLRLELAGWDSMGALLFMAALDEKFGVELTADESLQMTTISDALGFMRRHGVIADS